MTSTVQQILHALIALALIGGYVAMTVLGHDGNPLLTLLLGYLGATAVANSPTKG